MGVPRASGYGYLYLWWVAGTGAGTDFGLWVRIYQICIRTDFISVAIYKHADHGSTRPKPASSYHTSPSGQVRLFGLVGQLGHEPMSVTLLLLFFLFLEI